MALEEGFPKMAKKTIKFFLDEIYSKPPKKIIPLTNQTFIKLIAFGVRYIRLKNLRS